MRWSNVKIWANLDLQASFQSKGLQIIIRRTSKWKTLILMKHFNQEIEGRHWQMQTTFLTSEGLFPPLTINLTTPTTLISREALAAVWVIKAKMPPLTITQRPHSSQSPNSSIPERPTITPTSSRSANPSSVRSKRRKWGRLKSKSASLSMQSLRGSLGRKTLISDLTLSTCTPKILSWKVRPRPKTKTTLCPIRWIHAIGTTSWIRRAARSSSRSRPSGASLVSIRGSRTHLSKQMFSTATTTPNVCRPMGASANSNSKRPKCKLWAYRDTTRDSTSPRITIAYKRAIKRPLRSGRLCPSARKERRITKILSISQLRAQSPHLRIARLSKTLGAMWWIGISDSLNA